MTPGLLLCLYLGSLLVGFTVVGLLDIEAEPAIPFVICWPLLVLVAAIMLPFAGAFAFGKLMRSLIKRRKGAS